MYQSSSCPARLTPRRLSHAVESLRPGFELQLGEACVKAILGDKRLVRAFLDQAAIVENENPVGFEDCCEAMRDHKVVRSDITLARAS